MTSDMAIKAPMSVEGIRESLPLRTADFIRWEDVIDIARFLIEAFPRKPLYSEVSDTMFLHAVALGLFSEHESVYDSALGESAEDWEKEHKGALLGKKLRKGEFFEWMVYAKFEAFGWSVVHGLFPVFDGNAMDGGFKTILVEHDTGIPDFYASRSFALTNADCLKNMAAAVNRYDPRITPFMLDGYLDGATIAMALDADVDRDLIKSTLRRW